MDSRLLAGAAVFGVGWGLAGLCPGPAVTVLASGKPIALGFAGAMVVGTRLGWAAERGVGESRARTRYPARRPDTAPADSAGR